MTFKLMCEQFNPVISLSMPFSPHFPFSLKSHLWECCPFGWGFLGFPGHSNCASAVNPVCSECVGIYCARPWPKMRSLKPQTDSIKVGLVSQLSDVCAHVGSNLPVLSLGVCRAATSRSTLCPSTGQLGDGICGDGSRIVTSVITPVCPIKNFYYRLRKGRSKKQQSIKYVKLLSKDFTYSTGFYSYYPCAFSSWKLLKETWFMTSTSEGEPIAIQKKCQDTELISDDHSAWPCHLNGKYPKG